MDSNAIGTTVALLNNSNDEDTKKTKNKSNLSNLKGVVREEEDVAAAATAMTTMKAPPAAAVDTAVATAAALAAAAEDAAENHSPATASGAPVDAASSVAASITAAAAANGPPPMQLHPPTGSTGYNSSSTTSYHLWPSWPMVSAGVPMPAAGPPPPLAMGTEMARATTSSASAQQSTRPRGGQGKLKWESYFNLLVAYKNEHQNLFIPKNYTTTTTRDHDDPEESGGTGSGGGTDSNSSTITIDLGKWCCTQRVLYKRKLHGHKYTITQERVDRLTNLGFPWEVTTSKTRKLPWQYYYDLLIKYKNRHGNLNIPPNYISTEQGDGRSIKLGWWVNRQRSTLRKIPRTNITKDVRQQQIELLNQIGFLWDAQPHQSGQRNFYGQEQAAPWPQQQGQGPSPFPVPVAVKADSDQHPPVVGDGVENQAASTTTATTENDDKMAAVAKDEEPKEEAAV